MTRSDILSSAWTSTPSVHVPFGVKNSSGFTAYEFDIGDLPAKLSNRTGAQAHDRVWYPFRVLLVLPVAGTRPLPMTPSLTLRGIRLEDELAGRMDWARMRLCQVWTDVLPA